MEVIEGIKAPLLLGKAERDGTAQCGKGEAQGTCLCL